MSDHFADRYWGTRYWSARYFQGGAQNPGAMQANLSGAGSVSSNLTVFQQVAEQPNRYGGGGAPIWSEVSWFRKKKKPKKQQLIKEVAAVVEQAVPQVTEDRSRAVALRLVSQVDYEQLRKIQTLEAFVAKVEAELAEMDDEEVLLLAA